MATHVHNVLTSGHSSSLTRPDEEVLPNDMGPSGWRREDIDEEGSDRAVTS